MLLKRKTRKYLAFSLDSLEQGLVNAQKLNIPMGLTLAIPLSLVSNPEAVVRGTKRSKL